MGLFDAVRNHPSFASAVGGATIGAGAVAIAGAVGRRRKKTTKKKKASTRKKVGRPRKSKSKAKKSFKKRRAAAFRGASSKKIYTTKNGQPYIKLASGKARFISKKSAKTRRKRKGGFR